MKAKYWWNCEHKETNRMLGVAFCKKYDNFCLKNKCEELYDTKKELEKELIEND